MGYYTYHSINVDCEDPETIANIVSAMKEREIIPYAFDENFDTQESCKWYEEEEDMRAISAMFPTIHFEIHGEGEDAEDLWDAHYLGGKRQYCHAKIIYDPFDPAKLA